MSFPKLAITSQAFETAGELIEFCHQHECFDVEYTFDRQALTALDIEKELPVIRELKRNGCCPRFHLAFPGREIADPDPARAIAAADLYRHCMAMAASEGASFATLHIGLGLPPADIDYAAAVDHLSQLVEFSDRCGVTLSLENLRKGWLNQPETFRQLVEQSGSKVTMDIGHAVAREQHGHSCAMSYIDTLGPAIREAHVYEIEKSPFEGAPVCHMAPDTLAVIEPVLTGLLHNSACDYWLIELMDKNDIAHTLKLLRAYLDKARVCSIFA